jgi:hypothetical protein
MRWSYPREYDGTVTYQGRRRGKLLVLQKGVLRFMTTILHKNEFWTYEIAAGQTSYGWYVGPWDDLTRGVFVVTATPWSLVAGTTNMHRPQTLEVSEPREHAVPITTDVGIRTQWYVYFDIWNRGNYGVKQWYLNWCLILP